MHCIGGQMQTVQKSLRIPRTTQHAIEDLATEMGLR